MSVDQITQLINGVGFPIVACGALFWMLNGSFKSMQETFGEFRKTMDEVRLSLDRIAQRLDRLEGFHETA